MCVRAPASAAAVRTPPFSNPSNGASRFAKASDFWTRKESDQPQFPSNRHLREETWALIDYDESETDDGSNSEIREDVDMADVEPEQNEAIEGDGQVNASPAGSVLRQARSRVSTGSGRSSGRRSRSASTGDIADSHEAAPKQPCALSLSEDAFFGLESSRDESKSRPTERSPGSATSIYGTALRSAEEPALASSRAGPERRPEGAASGLGRVAPPYA
ncbi:Protein of unknown function, partial [Gryllus bimaculatus]